MDAPHVFTASRLTSGNFFFPERIEVSPDRVSRIKPRLFGSLEESIAIPKVASISIETGMFWAQIRIDSTGGSDPITSHGHKKQNVAAIRDLIEKFQVGLKTNSA